MVQLGNIDPGKPLSTLVSISGISHTQSSLETWVYLVLGEVLAKDWCCSVADHRWGEPITALGTGLKAYLSEDIQKPSVAANTVSIIWARYLYPDLQ